MITKNMQISLQSSPLIISNYKKLSSNQNKTQRNKIEHQKPIWILESIEIITNHKHFFVNEQLTNNPSHSYPKMQQRIGRGKVVINL